MAYFTGRKRGKETGKLSLIEATASLLRLSQLRELSNDCNDWRELPDRIALILGLSPDVVCEKIAGRMGCAAVPGELLASTDSGSFNIESYRRVGAVPLFKDGSVTGVACIDPRRTCCPDLPPREVPRVLAPWSSISRALNRGNETRTRGSFLTVARQVLSLLLEEVEEAGRSRVQVTLANGKINYSYLNVKGTPVEGEINRMLLSPLEELFRSALKVKLSVSLRGEQRRDILVSESSPGLYSLRWMKHTGGSEKSENLPCLKGVSSEQIRVLLVDDNETFCSILSRFFEREGKTVIASSDLERTLEELRNRTLSPDAIVCDLHMPGKSGFDFAQELRTISGFERTPLLMLTSDNSSDAKVEAINLGVDAFVTKAEDPRIISAHVDQLLVKSNSRKDRRCTE